MIQLNFFQNMHKCFFLNVNKIYFKFLWNENMFYNDSSFEPRSTTGRLFWIPSKQSKHKCINNLLFKGTNNS